jgi:hypothetical protein
MEIIKQGTPKAITPAEVYYGTCDHCGCEVRCKGSEVRFLNDTTLYRPYVKCPTDGSKDAIFLSEEKSNSQ